MLKSTFNIPNPLDQILEHFEVLFSDNHMMQHTIEWVTSPWTVSAVQSASAGMFYPATVDQGKVYDTHIHQYVGRFELKNVTFRMYLAKNGTTY